MAVANTTIGKIDLGGIIKSHAPGIEEVIDASRWYITEEMTLDFGEYVGRPSENILMHTNMLTYFFAYGWKVSEVSERKSSGEWVTKSVSSAAQTSASLSENFAKSGSKGVSEATPSNGVQGSIGYAAKTNASQAGASQGLGAAYGVGGATQEVSSDGDPYWCAYQKVKLTRRRMDGELVLKDMVASFTKAYNEGRTVNNARYDELVALYSLMLSHTEDEANAIPIISLSENDFIALGEELATSVSAALTITPANIKTVYDDALKNIRNALSGVKTLISDLPSDWLASRKDEISRDFEAKINQTKAAMIANGTYGSTAWANVLSGFTRDKQFAINNLSDSVVTLKVDTYSKVATLSAENESRIAEAVSRLAAIETSMADVHMRAAETRGRLLESAARIVEAIQKNRIGITELRNTVLKWMFEFMERREDEYPGIEQLATVAERLGYGDGGAKPA